MSSAHDRLVSLIEFAQQSARLRSKFVSSVAQHRLFSMHEHEIQGLPGIHLDLHDAEGDDEVWLSVERLHPDPPPRIKSEILRPWVEVQDLPTEPPKLLGQIDLRFLGATTAAPETGQNSKAGITSSAGAKVGDSLSFVSLADFAKASIVRSQFSDYLDSEWRPWAEREKPRRRSIQLYSKLFTLKQQLEGGIVESQIELVWGAGICVWNCDGMRVAYPLVTRLVELALDPENGNLKVRPRQADARLEIDWCSGVENCEVSVLEKTAKDHFAAVTTTFSPFDQSTFESLLRSAATTLDAHGVYWPETVPSEDRSIPDADEHLKVTNTWVVFARPRTQGVFLQDLEKLKEAIQESEGKEELPPAVKALVTDPETTSREIDLPEFRGLSVAYAGESGSSSPKSKVRDLYFPKAFNDEQVRIVQLLEVFNGVVVQGPPGTGKTHTIANVICHFLANGKRVLVTSMKDPALAVLQEQLPEEIRPLSIALLASEHGGMKQFEHAIHKIASEVQSLDLGATKREILRLQERIEALHGSLAGIDRKISDWARRNLAKIRLDDQEIDPQDAAREVVSNEALLGLIPDEIGVAPTFAPRFSDSEIVQLREARRELGIDIDYLHASLPQLVEFPEARALLDAHVDLCELEKLKLGIERGEVPTLADSGPDTLARAANLAVLVETLRGLREEVVRANQAWTNDARENLRRKEKAELFKMLEALGAELNAESAAQKSFLARPVETPGEVERDLEVRAAIGNLAEGRSPFGLIAGLLGKSEQKRRLRGILILGNPPASAADWRQVLAFLDHLQRLRALALRWNQLAAPIGLAPVPGDAAEGGLKAAELYGLYAKVRAIVQAESDLRDQAVRVFPRWPHHRLVSEDAEKLDDLERALRHHLAKNRLANVWNTMGRFSKVLDGRQGRVVEDLRRFLKETLGNSQVSEATLQSTWSALMTELSRVLALKSALATVRDVCALIEDSGASQFAESLRQPLQGAHDPLLPDNLKSVWRVRRLASHLDSIDAHLALKKLAREREELSTDLARAYRDIVGKRTWLNLTQNASHSVRAALQGYLNAIMKIGKGTGKRAVRYRQDARKAAELANPAVPAWIMPHYRVSESLPPRIGCFDLVVIDEASQSDLTALPAMLRAKKILVVGDDKQVSPEGVGLEEDKVRNLMGRFLADQVPTFGPQMAPDRSMYDLFKVVFAGSSVTLKEHFRCVTSIIEYSKREFYNHELRPLRIPRASERLDPPLIDVVVENGFRTEDVNLPEVRFIVDEIRHIVADPRMKDRSIGVVSLLADKQAFAVWERLTAEVGPDVIRRHQIACGDARTFQGKERDIMFLSMVSAPNDVGAPPTRATFEQRFNVAASRARDRMYLVRSVGPENLSDADKLRRSLIAHFSSPFAQDEVRAADLRKLCESPFEREMYDELISRGYLVTPQVGVGQYRIDLVVEGGNDERLAIECDGDQYHGADQWASDMRRQRVLERAGWVFWRCFASAFLRRRGHVIEDLQKSLRERGIEPVGAAGARRSIHTERRTVSPSMEKRATLNAFQECPTVATSSEIPPVGPQGARADFVAPPLRSVTATDRPAAERTAAPLDAQQTLFSRRESDDLDPKMLREVEQLCRGQNLKSADHRAKLGALWVYHLGTEGPVAARLKELGFKFANNKGWWIK
ncbi:MAG: AAA domain-containing protein [Planctomycetota bacterium]